MYSWAQLFSGSLSCDCALGSGSGKLEKWMDPVAIQLIAACLEFFCGCGHLISLSLLLF